MDALCGYCTGYSSESFADLFYCDAYYKDLNITEDQNPLRELIEDRVDEDGNNNPCAPFLSRSCEENESVFSAPLAVGIFCRQKPTEEQIKLIEERAAKFFAEIYLKPVTITGTRLLRETVYSEEIFWNNYGRSKNSM